MALTSGRWFLLCLLLPIFASTENGVVVKQSLTILPHETILKILPASVQTQNLQAVAEFFKQAMNDDLHEKLKRDSLAFQKPETSIFLGEHKNRMDMQSPIGRQSMLYDKQEGVLYDIFWSQKKYLQVNIADLKKQRAAVLISLEHDQNNDSTASIFENEKETGAKSHFRKTSGKRKFAGFSCGEFVYNSGAKLHLVWVSRRTTKMLRKLRAFYLDIRNDIDARSTGEADIWHDYPDAIPLASLKVVKTPHDELLVEISVTTSITAQTFMPDFFRTPKDFSRGDIFDTLQLDRSRPPQREQ